MTWQASIQAAVRALKKEEASLERQLATVRKRVSELGEVGRSGNGKAVTRASNRKMSAAGRAAISKAAKKRWARYRAEKRASGPKSGRKPRARS